MSVLDFELGGRTQCLSWSTKADDRESPEELSPCGALREQLKSGGIAEWSPTEGRETDSAK